jgi:hypothetical protein
MELVLVVMIVLGSVGMPPEVIKKYSIFGMV